MPTIDFTNVNDIEDFEPLPDGNYIVECIEVVESHTKKNDLMWTLKFEVIDEIYSGRFLFDRIIFSGHDIAKRRQKHILKNLCNIVIDGQITFGTNDFIGKQCIVSVKTESYLDENEKEKHTNKIDFAGYKKLDSKKIDLLNKTKDLPF